MKGQHSYKIQLYDGKKVQPVYMHDNLKHNILGVRVYWTLKIKI